MVKIDNRFLFKNDLQTALPFVLLGAFYITTNPILGTAKLVFRTFTIARYLHTIFYVYAVSILTNSVSTLHMLT